MFRETVKEKVTRPMILTWLFQIDRCTGNTRRQKVASAPPSQETRASKGYVQKSTRALGEKRKKNVPHPFASYRPVNLGTPVGLTVVKIHVLIFDFGHRHSLFHSTKSNLLSSAVLADVSSVGDTPALQVPLLNAANDVHTQLPILLQRVLPMRWDSVAQRQVSCDAVDHHLAHLVVFARVCVDVLYPPQARVCLVVVVERPHGLHDVIAQLGDLELLAQEVEVEKRSDVLLGLGVAQGARVEPADKELEGEVIGVREAIGLGFALAVLFIIEDFAEEGGMVAE